MSPENKRKLISRRDFIKIGGAFAIAATGTFACVEPTISPNAWDPTIPATETVIPPLLGGEINTISDQVKIQELIDRLPEDKPSISEILPPQAFEIKIGNLNLPFVIYNIADISDMQVIKTNIPEQGDSYTLQNIALYAPIVKKDNTIEMTRLAATIVPGSDETKDSQVIWYYQPGGFPDPEVEVPVDLSNPALLYNIKVSTGVSDCQAYYEPMFEDVSNKPTNWDGRLLQINTCVTEPTATKSLLAPVSPNFLFEQAKVNYPELISWKWDNTFGLVSMSKDNQTLLVFDFEKNEWKQLLTKPTAEELAFAEKDTIAPEFTFGGYKWNATLNESDEKVWVREDGKINLEWVDDVYGGYHQYYMFVTRSEQAENKRKLEIYSDPRDSIFYTITGDPNETDTFVGTTVAGVLKGEVARNTLLEKSSTLIIINGGIENWPLGGSQYLKRQNLSYQNFNNETVWQKIWGGKVNGTYGIIGPFVTIDSKTVQCAIYRNPGMWIEKSNYLKANPDSTVLATTADISAIIRQGASYDPEQSEVPSQITKFEPSILTDILTGEIVSSNLK